MSRLAGRLSMGADCGDEGRNKRMMSGMLAHLNGGNGSGASGQNRRSSNLTRELPEKGDSDSDVNQRVTRSQTAASSGVQGGYRGNSGRGRGGSYVSRNSQNDGHEGRFQSKQERADALIDKKVPKKHTSKIEDNEPAEELLDVDDIIFQISELSFKSDRSAAQIKRNINHSNECLELMTEEEWQKLCKNMIDSALVKGESAFVVDLFSSLLKNAQFCETMSEELHNVSSEQMMKIEDSNVPAFFAAIVCANYPREYSKALQNVNQPLFTTMCLVKGWIDTIDVDTEKFHKKEKKPAYKPIEETDEDAEKIELEPVIKVDDESEEEEIIDPELLNKCAIALCLFCETAQRQLWMKWPTTCDELYACFKPAIAYNTNLTGDVKMRLLSNYININNWTRTRSVNFKTSQTQTSSE